MNRIKLKEIIVTDKKCVRFNYDVEGDWASCFSSQRTSFIEYDTDVSCVPSSVLAVSFVCNVLPAVWLCDAVLEVETLDLDFKEHVDRIKEGFCSMYPMLSFKGSINARPEKNDPLKFAEGSACFFSGGVDAHTTFFKHADERPALLSIWGSDIKLNDKEGWENAWAYTSEFSEVHEVDCFSIKSDFRSVLLEGKLDEVVAPSDDRWWHGFQNSIAIISHAAALAYVFGWRDLYLASSFSEDIEGRFTGSSVPSIDNNVCFCGCKTCHDGYELNRQQKLNYLIGLHEKIRLRVCWESSGGRNCSSCEKCFRTILGLVAEGADPNDYGFVWNRSSIAKCRKDFKNKIEIYEYDYHPIQDAMISNSASIPDIESYKWFTKLDLSSVNNMTAKRLKRSSQALKRKISGKIRGA